MKYWTSPKPRKRELLYHPFNFPVVSARRLPPPDCTPTMSLLDAIAARRSSRAFRAPLSDEQLSYLLWHSCRSVDARRETGGFVWQHRPAPSSGGRHPIHLLLLNRA